ncbi:hypothetical protein DFH11DRAFT_1747272 [Phellopilus nigrolimitatus]|nr:hypothetical protein DFH11DRAFT_1747272 [Phellopilus nigrolimitatus]
MVSILNERKAKCSVSSSGLIWIKREREKLTCHGVRHSQCKQGMYHFTAILFWGHPNKLTYISSGLNFKPERGKDYTNRQLKLCVLSEPPHVKLIKGRTKTSLARVPVVFRLSRRSPCRRYLANRPIRPRLSPWKGEGCEQRKRATSVGVDPWRTNSQRHGGRSFGRRREPNGPDGVERDTGARTSRRPMPKEHLRGRNYASFVCGQRQHFDSRISKKYFLQAERRANAPCCCAKSIIFMKMKQIQIEGDQKICECNVPTQTECE